jgi:hypothetical protein
MAHGLMAKGLMAHTVMARRRTHLDGIGLDGGKH